jgi:putative hydrolase of the HAD superfamily
LFDSFADLAGMIRWIVFDAVGTLITPSPSVAEAYHRVGAEFGSRLDVAEVGRRFREFFVLSETACFPPERYGRTSEPEERERWRWIVEHVFDDVGGTCYERLWDHFASPGAWRLFDDVPATIERLTADGYRLAMASNFDARLHGLCDTMSVLQEIAPRLVSSEVGYRKPAAPFYEAVIAACDVAADSILMVGDDWEADIVAAKQAGLQAQWLDRRGAPSPWAINTLLDLRPARFDAPSD